MPSAKSMLMFALGAFVVVAIVGNVSALRNLAIPATPRIGG